MSPPMARPPQPEYERLVSELEAADARLAQSIRGLDASWGRDDTEDAALSECVAHALRRGADAGLYDVSTLAAAFSRFAGEFHARQIDFLRSGRYREADYEQVARAVYANDTYLETEYYPALLLSYLAAPNYRQLLRSFGRALGRWRAAGVRRIVDVASGHGLLLLLALERLPQAAGVAVDVAPAAQRFAEALQRATGWGAGRFRFAVADLLALPAGFAEPSFDAALCCELLEHVPEPALFLTTIHGLLAPGGRLFLSAAVRMESVDHLTLFRTTAEVAELLAKQGYRVEQESSVPFVSRPPHDEAHRRKLLANPLLAATFVAECVRCG